MSSSRKRSSRTLIGGITVLLILICIFVWLHPGVLNPFADHRLSTVSEGDFVRVRNVMGGVRLEVYSKQEFASEKGNESLTLYLNSLPRVKSRKSTSLVVSSAEGNVEETYASSRILDLQHIHPAPNATVQFWPSETTLEEAEFHRFGDVSLTDHLSLIDQVAASDMVVSTALLNSMKGNTQANTQAEVRRFRQLEVGEYVANSSDTADATEAGRIFLEEYFDLTSKLETAQTAEEIEQLAARALAISSDPTVRIYSARHKFNLGRLVESQQMVEDVLEAESGRLPPTTRFIADTMYLSAFQSPNGNVSGSSHSSAITNFIESSREFQAVLKAHPEGLAFASDMYRSVWTSLGDGGREQLLKSLFQDPGSDLWLCHSLACLWHFQEGWKFRGNKFISEVDQQDRVRFAAELHLSAWHALSASKLRSDLSFPVLMLVEMARTGEVPIGSTRSWFLQGIRSQFDYIGFYEAYLLSLTPKWGGSHQAMIEFANACAGCNRFDTDVPAFVMECIESLQQDISQQANDATRKEVVWKRPDITAIMLRFRNSLPVKSDDPAVARRVRDAMERCLAIAVHSKNFTEARVIFDLLGDDVEYSWFRHYELQAGAGVRRQVYAESGPARELVAEFEAMIAGSEGFANFARDAVTIRRKLEAIRAADKQAVHQEYCDAAVTILDRWEQFETGDAVSLSFTGPNELWDVQSGDGMLAEDSFSIPANPDRKQPTWAKLNLQFPVPFQFNVDLSLRAASGTRNSAGILIADPDVSLKKKSPTGVFIFLSRSNNGVWWTAMGRSPSLLGETELHPVNRLEVSVYNDHCDVSVNGTIRGTVPRSPSAAGAEILLGSPVFSMTDADSIYQDCSIQKLPGSSR